MKTIVIVEDHPVLISIYRNKFITEGFKVEIASDGESGLELINRIRPNLVVLDLAMPKVNGIEVLKTLRANPSFKHLPIIIFSDSAWKQQALREGATVVLSKSKHSPSQVVEAAQSALARSEQSASMESDSQKLDHTVATNVAFLAGKADLSADAHSNQRTDAQVLLVEDHYDIRTTISSALDRSGFRVTAVDCHVAALHEIETNEFDAFLLNRVCPDGIGLSLCRQLRSLYAQKAIVMYSTATLPITQEQRLQAGASAYLSEAGDILNPGPILLELIDKAKANLSHIASNAELVMLGT